MSMPGEPPGDVLAPPESPVETTRPKMDRTAVLRRQILVGWDRAMVWLHQYLALNVQPSTRYYEDLEKRPTPERSRASVHTAETAAVPEDVLRWSGRSGEGGNALPTFSVGDRPAEAFEIQRIVSVGPFGTVYLAHHEHWNIELVVEVPSPELAAVSGAVAELAARAEQWKAIGLHPHIAACYYVHWLGGVPLRIREYIEAEDLRAWIVAGRGADVRGGLDLAIQVCHALEHAHSRGIVHGYLTPERILIKPQGAPKLIDFGARRLARRPSTPVQNGIKADHASSAAQWRLRRGGPYVAPERWTRPCAPDAEDDVFALGACLYELFFGSVPYATTNEDPQPLLEGVAPSALPTELASLLRQTVGWDREGRPASMEDLRIRLTAVFEGLFGEARALVSAEADEWNSKAVSYFYLGREADADAAWEYALEADPLHLDALFNQGLVRWRRGAMTDEQFIQQLETLQVEREERWKLHYFLGLINEERGDNDDAASMVAQANRDHPDIPEVGVALDRIRHGRLRMQRGAAVLDAHRDYVSAACLTADGQLALSASHDGTAILWDVRSGSSLRRFEGSEAPLSCAWLTPDGSWAVTGSDDHTLRFWDVASGECSRVLPGHAGRIAAVSLNADASVLLWSGNFVSQQSEGMTVQLWDAQTGKSLSVLEGHTSSVKALWLSADARWALTGSDDQTVRLWDAATGRCTRIFEGHQHFVSAVCLSSDGAYALSGSWDQTLRLWDVQSGRCVRTFTGHRALVTSICLSGDGRWALSGGWDCTVRLWEVATGRCVRTFPGHTSLVTAVAISADGRLAISGSWDSTVRVWDLPEAGQYACPLRLSAPLAQADAVVSDAPNSPYQRSGIAGR